MARAREPRIKTTGITETLRGISQPSTIVTIRMLQATVGICAVATFGGTVRESDSPWFCGPVGWVMTDVLVLPEAVPCKGAQGLWNVPDDALAKMRAQFATREDRA
jgi:hypothetical protein